MAMILKNKLKLFKTGFCFLIITVYSFPDFAMDPAEPEQMIPQWYSRAAYRYNPNSRFYLNTEVGEAQASFLTLPSSSTTPDENEELLEQRVTLEVKRRQQ